MPLFHSQGVNHWVVLSLLDYRNGEGQAPTSDSSEHTMKAFNEEAIKTSKEQTVKISGKQAMKTSNKQAVKVHERCLSVLHFLPQDHVCQHHIVGNSVQVVVPYPEDEVRYM